MEKLIISYQKEWDNGGTTYNQKIKLPISLLAKINEKLKKVVADKAHPLLWTSTNYIYIDLLKEGKNFTKLTTARIVKYELEALGVDVKRYLDDRNTIIETY